MKISIITVCYNSGKTIEDTLKSVLSQTYTNYEYVIKDGGSTDNTLDIIKEYEPKFKGKIKLITGPDKGLYNAMNIAISNAKGDIVGIINSDDVLASNNVFQSVIDNIEGYDAVFSNLIFKDENLDKIKRRYSGKVKNYKLGWHPPHPTLYIKKYVYDDIGTFNTKFKIAADYDFMLRLMKSKYKLKYVDDVYVYMRTGGVSTNGFKGYKKNFNDSYDVLIHNDINFPIFVAFKRSLETLIEMIKK